MAERKWYGLEQHKGEQMITNVHFGWSNTSFMPCLIFPANKKYTMAVPQKIEVPDGNSTALNDSQIIYFFLTMVMA